MRTYERYRRTEHTKRIEADIEQENDEVATARDVEQLLAVLGADYCLAFVKLTDACGLDEELDVGVGKVWAITVRLEWNNQTKRLYAAATRKEAAKKSIYYMAAEEMEY